MFLCKKCLIQKEHSFFVKDKRKKHGISFLCKQCSNSYKNAWSSKKQNKEKKHNYYLKNIEKLRFKNNQHYLNNKESYIQRAKSWKTNNLDKHALNEAKRREKIRLSTPKWLSAEQKNKIKRFYKERPIGMTVDHIIPIRGKDVSGLHVPWNLQYLTIQDNVKKFNKIPVISGKNTDVASAMIGG
jgi:hypothetical protein